MKRAIFLAAIGALIVSAHQARANDSAAAIGAGGIELRQQGDVRMVSEDLYVSRPKITVRYEFLNEGASPVRTLVAFPLPSLDLADMREAEIGWPSNDQTNPVGFKVTVDGRAVTPKLERKATLKGKDVSAELNAAGVPIVYPFGSFWEDVKKVSKTKIDALAKRGLVEVIKETNEVMPNWTVANTYYWEQVFPPGQIVKVEHEYAPVIGGSFWYESDQKSAAELAKDQYLGQFCLDEGTLRALRAKSKTSAKRAEEGPTMLSYHDIRYILKTGRNWKGPIGQFSLTVDKGAPANLVSFCADGVTKSGPTTFRVQKTNWEPVRDLAVIIFQAATD